MRNVKLGHGVCAVAALLCASSAFGQFTSTLQDGNSLVHFDTNPANTGNRIGMDQWTVNGVNHLFNQWFWYRVGSGGPENRINTLPQTFRQTFDLNANGQDDALTIQYNNGSIFMETKFSLQGGTALSGVSDVAEQIKIVNVGNTTLPFHFFQYCDFDLNNDIVDDSASIQNPPLFNTAFQIDGPTTIAESVVTPTPSRHEVNIYPTTINLLDDAASYDLNNNSGPLGPGRLDYTWAFQWDFVLAPGASFEISKDKHLAPTPGSAVILLGAVAVGSRRRRR